MRSRRHDPDVERYVATYGGMESMLLWVLDSGCPAFVRDIPRGMLPALYERFGDRLAPTSWAAQQLEQINATGP